MDSSHVREVGLNDRTYPPDHIQYLGQRIWQLRHTRNTISTSVFFFGNIRIQALSENKF